MALPAAPRGSRRVLCLPQLGAQTTQEACSALLPGWRVPGPAPEPRRPQKMQRGPGPCLHPGPAAGQGVVGAQGASASANKTKPPGSPARRAARRPGCCRRRSAPPAGPPRSWGGPRCPPIAHSARPDPRPRRSSRLEHRGRERIHGQDRGPAGRARHEVHDHRRMPWSRGRADSPEGAHCRDPAAATSPRSATQSASPRSSRAMGWLARGGWEAGHEALKQLPRHRYAPQGASGSTTHSPRGGIGQPRGMARGRGQGPPGQGRPGGVERQQTPALAVQHHRAAAGQRAQIRGAVYRDRPVGQHGHHHRRRTFSAMGAGAS